MAMTIFAIFLENNFAYLAEMALHNIDAIPGNGSLALDDIARANQDDVLVEIIFIPWRNEVKTWRSE